MSGFHRERLGDPETEHLFGLEPDTRDVRRVPQSQLSALQRGTFEGNVRIPLVDLGLTLFGLHHCLQSENPIEELRKINEPVAFDDALADRTRKGNAQHAFHGVKRVLTERVVHRSETRAHGGILYAIDHILGGVSPALKETDPKYQDPLTRYENLTLEHKTMLRDIMHVAVSALRDPHATKILDARRDLYVYGEQYPPLSQQRLKADREASYKAREVFRFMQDRVDAFVHTPGTDKVLVDFAKKLSQLFY